MVQMLLIWPELTASSVRNLCCRKYSIGAEGPPLTWPSISGISQCCSGTSADTHSSNLRRSFADSLLQVQVTSIYVPDMWLTQEYQIYLGDLSRSQGNPSFSLTFEKGKIKCCATFFWGKLALEGWGECFVLPASIASDLECFGGMAVGMSLLLQLDVSMGVKSEVCRQPWSLRVYICCCNIP